ncbi:hypothetical protein D1B31_18745 [Neobacillus notoginsengisoli]|uniref:DUF4367 domain-containing protein n=1 Tax=Neobacillus notoginsengisoli TaxID=1578198 RepID=A0A417YQ46_9BACI|nr:hypothetical protein [Neobacillus notoginsengisoli]RHW35683.1 hypothetical protein D1B31_18745 [Neobacillus notoginsengisoli]
MQPLTNDEIKRELSSFPRFELAKEERVKIAASLLKTETVSKPKKRLVPALFSFVILAALFIGMSTFVLNSLSGDNTWHSGATVYHGKKFSIDPMGAFAVKKLSNDTVEFYQEDKKVGGIEILTENEMHLNISKQNVFESNNLPGFLYPLRFTLDHQKTMEAVQIRHYFFLSEKSKLRYHVYFYSPDVGDSEAEKISRSFRIRE